MQERVVNKLFHFFCLWNGASSFSQRETCCHLPKALHNLTKSNSNWYLAKIWVIFFKLYLVSLVLFKLLQIKISQKELDANMLSEACKTPRVVETKFGPPLLSYLYAIIGEEMRGWVGVWHALTSRPHWAFLYSMLMRYF